VRDRNTSFHKQAQARRSFNTISEIKEDRVTHKDFTSIKGVTFSHFEKLYSEVEGMSQDTMFLDVVPSKISSNMNQQLEAKVTRKEIKVSLYEMEPDKAPGPDGFTARFIQVCW